MGASDPAIRPAGSERVLAPSGHEAASFDRWAIEALGVPQAVLMENAGRCAAHVLQRWQPSGRVVVLVGSGNNGGDALVLARTLAAWGRSVRILLASDRPADDPLLHAWPIPVDRDSDLNASGLRGLLDAADVVVDGLLGTGLAGPPRDRSSRVIDALTSTSALVMALDVPSGVDSDSGDVPGAAVQADVTVAFGAPKLGTILHPGRMHAGRVVAVDIGFPPWPDGRVRAELATPAWALAHLPRRGGATHKNAEGRLLVVSGAPGMAGATVLTVRAAFAAGTGLVRVCSAPENREILQASVPEAMFVSAEDGDALEQAMAASDAAVLGPGLGTEAFGLEAARRVITGSSAPLLLDADALNLLAAGAFELPAGAGGRSLMTPHPGEAARLLDLTTATLPTDRLGVARSLVERWGCTVLLKGAPSLVDSGQDPVLLDTQSSSDLAVAGMGDTLSGICGALLARGCPAREAGALGLYLSGRAARIAGRGVSLTPSDVVRWLHVALREDTVPMSDLELPFVLFDAAPAD